MYNVNTRGVHAPNVVVGMAIFSGGLLQFMAGMWEFPRGNTFGATGNALHSLFDTFRVFITPHFSFAALSSYGAFWMSYATILIPSSGIIAAYADPQELENALGIYLITWFMVTVLLMSVPPNIQSSSFWLNEPLLSLPPSEQFARSPEEHSVRVASFSTGSCILAFGMRIILGESIVSWFFIFIFRLCCTRL